MSIFMNNNSAFLDLSDLNLSLSYESFYEYGTQVIDKPSHGNEMCVRIELVEAATCVIGFSGSKTRTIDLPAGEHVVDITADLNGSAGLTLCLHNESGVLFTRNYSFAHNYGAEYSSYMHRLYNKRREAEAAAVAVSGNCRTLSVAA